MARRMHFIVTEASERPVTKMNAYTLTLELEKEIASTLINSSLYQELSPADRRRLIDYILTMYF